MKALVLGGGMSQAWLIKELKRRNITALLADMNANVPAVKFADEFYHVSALDVQGVKSIAVEQGVDFILSVCADQILLVAAQLSEELGLPFYIDYKTAKNVSNKEYMKKIFEKNGIPTSKYIVRDSLCLKDVAALEWPLIVKPVDCYSSKGVKKVANEDELFSAFTNAVAYSRTNTAIVEEYVSGEEYSVDYYIENGQAKMLCCRVLDKIPEGNGFIICRGKYPATITKDTEEAIVNIGQQIADAFGLKNTPMLVQLKIDDDKIRVIEFCARTGGGIKYRLMPRVSGFDVVKAVLDLTLGEKPHYDGYHLNKYIVDEFLYCYPGVLDHLEGFKELLGEGIIAHYDQFKPKGTLFESIESSGNRVAYFSVEADTMAELLQKHRIAGERVRAVSTTGKDLIRHDIIQFNPY